MRILLTTILLCVVVGASAQVSMGFILGTSMKETVPSGQALDKCLTLGMSVKKYVTPTLSIVSGVQYRFIDATVANLPQDNDLVTFYKDQHPTEFFHLAQGEYFRFNYVTVPIGLEYKITSFLRASYTWESNFLLGGNDTSKEYLQYQTKSLSSVMFTSNASLMLHTGNAMGIAIGAIFHPNIIRDDVKFTYEYMKEYSAAFKDSYLLKVSLWADFTFKKRKKL